jgi:hypothetical protein
MLVREEKKRPLSWKDCRQTIRHKWTLPFHALEWAFDWIAYSLSRWAFLEVLEYLGILSVLAAVIFYFAEADGRKQQKHYQAWQVINTAQGKGGNGGRIEALQELNADGVPLVGVNVSGAFLQGVMLPHADLLRCEMEASDLRQSSLRASHLAYASLRSANLRQSDLTAVNLFTADLEDADLVGADLTKAELTQANLQNADLRSANLSGVVWRKIKSIQSANVYGVRNAPPGFLTWAMAHGAISVRGDDE